ncbi:MAG: NAD(P)/FAD-dependent oxidoreductase [Candidatus Omnitrophica bacterium]|nr:NAD(P)/FAD-dependent oxidoreductase [Candidatus Omnitrophota bacterium]
MKNRILIVGGGPAGLMAAIRASQLGVETLLIEKKSFLGQKLLLSGKGRCNVTNACDLNSFLKAFSHGEFLRDAFRKFFNQDLIAFFEERGLKLKVERQLRVFPVSDKSSSILDVLIKEAQKNKVIIICNSEIKEVLTKGDRACGVLLKDGKIIEADSVILAMGGASYTSTGSTGDGVKIAKKLGHDIIPLKPALVPLEVKGGIPARLEGLTLKNIVLKFNSGSKRLTSEIGELLFTHFGVSGPLVISLSGKISDWIADGGSVFLDIDLKPALTEMQLDLRILREIKLSPSKSIKNMLKELLPLRLIDVFMELLKIDANKKSNQITQKERLTIVRFLKNFRLEIKQTLPIEHAMVTKGGVSLKNINPRTMESRLIKDLYFAGEMIDVDADTGGFNLQAAFSTGYLAGESAALG